MDFWELSTRQWLRRDSSAKLKDISPDWKMALTSEDPMGLIEYPFAAGGPPVRKGLGDVFNGTTFQQSLFEVPRGLSFGNLYHSIADTSSSITLAYIQGSLNSSVQILP